MTAEMQAAIVGLLIAAASALGHYVPKHVNKVRWGNGRDRRDDRPPVPSFGGSPTVTPAVCAAHVKSVDAALDTIEKKVDHIEVRLDAGVKAINERIDRIMDRG
jgi:hypothetical protein